MNSDDWLCRQCHDSFVNPPAVLDPITRLRKNGLEYAIQVLQKDGACLVSEVVNIFRSQLCDTITAPEYDTDRVFKESFAVHV